MFVSVVPDSVSLAIGSAMVVMDDIKARIPEHCLVGWADVVRNHSRLEIRELHDLFRLRLEILPRMLEGVINQTHRRIDHGTVSLESMPRQDLTHAGSIAFQPAFQIIPNGLEIFLSSRHRIPSAFPCGFFQHLEEGIRVDNIEPFSPRIRKKAFLSPHLLPGAERPRGIRHRLSKAIGKQSGRIGAPASLHRLDDVGGRVRKIPLSGNLDIRIPVHAIDQGFQPIPEPSDLGNPLVPLCGACRLIVFRFTCVHDFMESILRGFVSKDSLEEDWHVGIGGNNAFHFSHVDFAEVLLVRRVDVFHVICFRPITDRPHGLLVKERRAFLFAKPVGCSLLLQERFLHPVVSGEQREKVLLRVVLIFRKGIDEGGSPPHQTGDAFVGSRQLALVQSVLRSRYRRRIHVGVINVAIGEQPSAEVPAADQRHVAVIGRSEVRAGDRKARHRHAANAGDVGYPRCGQRVQDGQGAILILPDRSVGELEQDAVAPGGELPAVVRGALGQLAYIGSKTELVHGSQ